VIALAGFLAITALGAYFAYLTIMVSPTTTGAITAGVILAVTTAMGGAGAMTVIDGGPQ
jgi:hypothetical protein